MERLKKAIERFKDLRIIVMPWWQLDTRTISFFCDGWHFQYLHYLKTGKTRWKRKAQIQANVDEKEHLIIKRPADAGELSVSVFSVDEKGEFNDFSDRQIIDAGDYLFSLKPDEKMYIHFVSDKESEVE